MYYLGMYYLGMYVGRYEMGLNGVPSRGSSALDYMRLAFANYLALSACSRLINPGTSRFAYFGHHLVSFCRSAAR